MRMLWIGSAGSIASTASVTEATSAERIGLRSHDERGLPPREHPVRDVRNEPGVVLQIDDPGVRDHADDLEGLAAEVRVARSGIHPATASGPRAG